MKGTAATLNPHQSKNTQGVIQQKGWLLRLTHTKNTQGVIQLKRVAATLNPNQEHTRCDSTKGMAATPNPYICAEDAAINLAILDEGHVS